MPSLKTPPLAGTSIINERFPLKTRAKKLTTKIKPNSVTAKRQGLAREWKAKSHSSPEGKRNFLSQREIFSFTGVDK